MKSLLSPPLAQILVAVVDDHAVSRKGIAACLEPHGDLRLVGEGQNADEARVIFLRHKPHVALLNPRLPGSASFLAIADLCREFSEVRMLLYTTVENEAALYHAMQAGAAGCVLRSASEEELLGAIRHVATGERYFSPAAAQKLAGRAAHAELTARELEILRHVANGKSNKEIGALLFLAEDTVKRHLTHLFGKLHVVDRAHAVAAAMRRGLLDEFSI